ncbi:MAG: hypothetical protein IBX50_07655 [Marinospirillum sp.]|uniref:hypothetical protein n=1 Tax=Marinospirillum sp. TaxID=2183934 RepID=UPI0019E7F7CA|nr:hypothetical protein [Marinospirillum sp.]MBE0506582.1 hypothetical protein [Marinospirillum sp.]
MGFFESVGNTVFDQDVSKLLRISSGYGDHLYTSEGCRISVIRILGALRPQDGQEREYSMRKLEDMLSSWGASKGHRATLIYQQDSQGMERYLRSKHQATRKSLERMGLNLGFILDSREERLKDSLTIEETFLVLESMWGSLPSGKGDGDILWKMHQTKEAQSGIVSSALDQAHEAMLNNWLTVMKERLNIRSARLDARQAASVIASMWKGKPVDPASFRLPGDMPTMAGMSFDATRPLPKIDHRHLLLPSLQDQIMDIPVYFDPVRDDYCIIGERYYGAMRLVSMPSTPTNYNQFLNGIPRNIPFRASIQFSSGQGKASSIGLRRALGLMTALINPIQNMKIARTAKTVADLAKAGVVFAPMRMMLTTWAEDEKRLRSQMTLIESAFSTMGNAKAQIICEGVDQAVAQTLPGAKLTGTEIFMPSQMLSQILPLERTESPWQNAVMLCRTEDDKAYPIETGSSLQDFHTYILLGPPGSGKSGTMTTQLFNGALLRPGMDALPEVRYLDIGYTSKGPFTYFKSLLPKSRQHEIVHYQLSNSPRDAINILDTPLGADYPPPDEMSGICDFIELLIQDDDGHLPDFVSDIIPLLVRESYRYAAEINPEIYFSKVVPEIDKALIEQGFEVKEGSTWRDVRDFFFDRDMLYEAELAHQQAMPIWNNLATYLKDSEAIRNQFGHITVQGNMPLIEYLRTKLSAQNNQYRNLGGSTKLNFSSAKMIAIDLQNVASSKRHTEVFYALARFALVKGWFMDPDTVAVMEGLPEKYRSYHRRRLKNLRSTDKWLFYDELHRPAQASPSGDPDDSRIMKTLMRDNREIRKYRVRMVLGSQTIEHMPSELKNDGMWSMVIIQGSKSTKGRERLKELFGITDFGMKALEDRVRGPVPGKGATVLMLAETKLGRIEQTIIISPSAAELWAAPSEAQDATVMQEVIERLGDPERAVKALAGMYPTGSARAEIDKRIDESNGEFSEARVTENIVDEVVNGYRSRG